MFDFAGGDCTETNLFTARYTLDTFHADAFVENAPVLVASVPYSDSTLPRSIDFSGIDPGTAHETFKACYPFHPSVLSVFQRKWQSLPRFQRTRGILRLLALWVAHAFQEPHRKAMR